MDNGWEWQARRAFPSDSVGGEFLLDRAEHWDNEDWQRLTLESENFSPTLVDSFCWVETNWLSAWRGRLSLSEVMSDWENSKRLLLGVVKGEFIISAFAEGDKEDICWSKAFLYSERRYCSKCVTSTSSTAISLMSSVAGWNNQKINNSIQLENKLVNLDIMLR